MGEDQELYLGLNESLKQFPDHFIGDVLGRQNFSELVQIQCSLGFRGNFQDLAQLQFAKKNSLICFSCAQYVYKLIYREKSSPKKIPTTPVGAHCELPTQTIINL